MSSPPAALRRPAVQSALLGAGVFLVYVLGACRTIYVGDSGELTAAAALPGIPHPSGYPLYVLLGHLWTLLVPIGSVAFRMSLFSGFCGALAVALLAWVLRRNEVGGLAATVGALCLALAPSFWSQATVQRVYTLNVLFVVAVLGCALEWHRTRSPRWLVLGSLLTGLGACNHTVMALVGLAVGAAALLLDPGLLRRWRFLLACVGAAFAGLLPYLYLPIRSRQDPRLDWGDPETLDRFLAVVGRRDFWQRSWAEGPADWVVIAGDYLRGLGIEVAWAGLALAVLGVVAAGRERRPWLLPVAIMVVNLAAVGLHGSRSDIFIWHRYYLPSYVMLAVLVAWGVQALTARRGRLAAVTLLVPALLLASGWNRFDRSDFLIADDFSRQLLAGLPPGAHLAASDDNILFVLIYLHLVEGVRPDVDLILQGVGSADLGTLRFDPDDDPLFFTHHPNWNQPGLEVLPVGLAFQVVRSGTTPPPLWPVPEGDGVGLAGADDPAVPKDYLASNLVGHHHYMFGITHEQRDWPTAERWFRRATEAAPDNDVLFYNLGLIYHRNGLPERALGAFRRAAEINSRPIPSARPVSAADRVAELGEEARGAAELARQIRRASGMPTEGELDAEGHLAVARGLLELGRDLLARGHRLRAAELEAGLPSAALEITGGS